VIEEKIEKRALQALVLGEALEAYAKRIQIGEALVRTGRVFHIRYALDV
jgi:hypothetical protein